MVRADAHAERQRDYEFGLVRDYGRRTDSGRWLIRWTRTPFNSESQYGVLVRYDKPTGQELVLQPQEGKGEAALRWNWDSPIIISPHSHTRLYFAANKLFRSDDRGDTWKAISGIYRGRLIE